MGRLVLGANTTPPLTLHGDIIAHFSAEISKSASDDLFLKSIDTKLLPHLS